MPGCIGGWPGYCCGGAGTLPGGMIGFGSSSSITFGMTTIGCGRFANGAGAADCAGGRLTGMIMIWSYAEAPGLLPRGLAM
jgi:hypothetical protein